MQVPQLLTLWGTQPPLHCSVPVGQMQVPVTQLCPGRQASAQEPQWLASFWRSTQAPPQLVRLAAQVWVHRLLLHTSLVLQVLKQPPQFFGSLVRSTQAPLQEASGAWQTQLLLTHGWPGAQWVPQAPQFEGSLVVLVQIPAQLTWPGPQVLVHLLARQSLPGPQTTLQPPQLSGSDAVLTHELPHCLRPALQLLTQPEF